MRNDRFDRIIKEKMERYEAPPRPGHWELLEQQLDAAGHSAHRADAASELDQEVSQKMNALSAPYRPSHWARMATRLDREFVNAREVLRYKAMELSLMLLIMLTLWARLPSPSEQPITAAPNAKIERPAAPNAETSPVDKVKNAETARHEAARRAAPAADAAMPARVAPRPPVSTPAATGLGTLGAPPAERRAEAPLSPLARKKISAPEEADETPRTERFAASEPLSALPTRAASPLDQQSAPESPAVARSHARSRFWNFGMFGSMDYNRIMTPAVQFLDVKSREFDRYALGYSGGFSVGFEYPRWEIQTGFIYSAKRYQPLQVTVQRGRFQDGYVREQLKEVELNIVQVPLHLRYNFYLRNRLRLYGLAGGALQVAMSADYFVETVGALRSARPPDGGGSFFAQKGDNGLLDGGALRENSYLTANFGVGIEHFVATRWSWFAQPTYHHSLNLFQGQGLGPTMDRISTMSLYTGIRVRMER
jgi:hypothetical protein